MKWHLNHSLQHDSASRVGTPPKANVESNFEVESRPLELVAWYNRSKENCEKKINNNEVKILLKIVITRTYIIRNKPRVFCK